MTEGQTWDGAAYVNLGAYQHGGITSITVATEKFAKEAELAARLLSLDHPGKVFTSVALVKTATMHHIGTPSISSLQSIWRRHSGFPKQPMFGKR